MNNLDDALRDTLRPDDTPSVDGSFQDAISRTFTRHMRGLMVIVWIKMIFFVVAAGAAAYVFVNAESARTQIGAAAAFVVFALGTCVMFVLYWMQVNAAMITREIKRLELRVSRISKPE